MPGWLQTFVDVNPLTHLVGADARAAARRRADGLAPACGRSPGWPACWWSSCRSPCGRTVAASEPAGIQPRQGGVALGPAAARVRRPERVRRRAPRAARAVRRGDLEVRLVLRSRAAPRPRRASPRRRRAGPGGRRAAPPATPVIATIGMSSATRPPRRRRRRAPRRRRRRRRRPARSSADARQRHGARVAALGPAAEARRSTAATSVDRAARAQPPRSPSSPQQPGERSASMKRPPRG